MLESLVELALVLRRDVQEKRHILYACPSAIYLFSWSVCTTLPPRTRDGQAIFDENATSLTNDMMISVLMLCARTLPNFLFHASVGCFDQQQQSQRA
jgi:hypothetical protein